MPTNTNPQTASVQPENGRLLSIAEMEDLLREASEKIRRSKKYASADKIDTVRQALGQGALHGFHVPKTAADVQTAQAVPDDIAKPNKPEKLEEYVAQNGEIDESLIALSRGKNLLFTGPTGCGKTHLSHWLAHLRKQPIRTIQGMEGLQADDIIGYPTVESVNGAVERRFIEGLLPITMQEGGLLYLDEPNVIPDSILFALFGAMDMRREITLTQDNGRVVKAHPNFRVIAAMNEGYSGTHTLNQAFRRRSVIKNLSYLPADREKKLLQERTGIAMPIAEKLVALAAQLRGARQRGEIRTDIGTASLLDCADLMQGKMSDKAALEMTIINQVPANMGPEHKAVADAVAAFFPMLKTKGGK